MSTLYAAVTGVSKNYEIKGGSNLFICMVNLEFHFTKLYHSVNSKSKNNCFQRNELRFAAIT